VTFTSLAKLVEMVTPNCIIYLAMERLGWVDISCWSYAAIPVQQSSNPTTTATQPSKADVNVTLRGQRVSYDIALVYHYDAMLISWLIISLRNALLKPPGRDSIIKRVIFDSKVRKQAQCRRWFFLPEILWRKLCQSWSSPLSLPWLLLAFVCCINLVPLRVSGFLLNALSVYLTQSMVLYDAVF